MSFLLSFSWDLCWGTFLINPSVSLLLSLSLVYNGIVIGGQYYKLWQFFSSWEERWSSLTAFPFPHLPGCSLLGLTMGSVPFSLYLLLVSCVYRSNAHRSLPTDVPPALFQTTVTRTFAKPAVNLSRVSQRKGPVKMQTCLSSTWKRLTQFQESLRNKPYERQKDSLEVR